MKKGGVGESGLMSAVSSAKFKIFLWNGTKYNLTSHKSLISQIKVFIYQNVRKVGELPPTDILAIRSCFGSCFLELGCGGNWYLKPISLHQILAHLFSVNSWQTSYYYYILVFSAIWLILYKCNWQTGIDITVDI